VVPGFGCGVEEKDGTVFCLIVGSLVSPVLLLPYCAFLMGICYKYGVWMNLTVCLLKFVGACCLVHIVWRYPGGVYVADVFSVGCWTVLVSVLSASLKFLYKVSLYVCLSDTMCGEVPQALNVFV
jgi:hypothetical protein